MNITFNQGEAELIIEALTSICFDVDADDEVERESAITEASTRDELIERFEKLIEQDLTTNGQEEDHESG